MAEFLEKKTFKCGKLLFFFGFFLIANEKLKFVLVLLQDFSNFSVSNIIVDFRTNNFTITGC